MPQPAVLISALTTTFLGAVQNNPAIPKDLAAKAQVQLAGGVPVPVRQRPQDPAQQGERAAHEQ
jgi:hypothetical protein